MKKRLLSVVMSLAALTSLQAADYGIPTNIQDGNILHCFDWTFTDITNELPGIAAAGFGAIQVSPVQGNCATNAEWFFAYMPYDFCFKANGNGSRAQLQTLCSKAAEYGIKIIVDVVANHVNQASGYHDTWWDSNGRVRWNGGCNYGDRYSITHGQLGDYGDVNSEDSQVQARAKAFIEDLKSLGVKGIRWDAAKHIGLPSEGCGFWSAVTSVSGMWHYGEILDSPGGDGNKLMKEYTNYISVTDNGYGKNCRNNDGVPSSYAGWAAGTIDDSKVVYWGESHDEYANDGAYGENTAYIDQAKVDRAWAIQACRNGATALYFSRPSAKTRASIKMGQKGSLQYKQPQIAEVNKFRNIMVGKKDYFSQNGNAASVTRQNGGAVIVKKNGGGSVSVPNGGGYCPAGSYKDRVSGATFTVTATTISGNVGASGIAVIYNDGITPDPNPNPNPTPDPTPGDYPANVYLIGDVNGESWNIATPVAMTKNGGTYTVAGVKFANTQTGKCTFSFITTKASANVPANWDAEVNQSDRYGAAADMTAYTVGNSATVTLFAAGVNASAAGSWAVAPGTYDVTLDLSAMTMKLVNAGSTPDPTPDPTPGTLTITGDYNLCYSGSKTHVHYWGDGESTWPGIQMTTVTGSDGNTYKVAKIAAGATGLVFNAGGDSNKTGDLTYKAGYVHNDNGPTSTAVVFTNGSNPDPTPTPADGVYIFVDGWTNVYAYVYNEDVNPKLENSAWPGVAMTKDVATGYWKYSVPANLQSGSRVIINTGNGGANRYPADMIPGMQLNGKTMIFHVSNNLWEPYTFSGVDAIEADEAEVEYYNLQGVRVAEPTPGLYIVRRGNTVSKQIIR